MFANASNIPNFGETTVEDVNSKNKIYWLEGSLTLAPVLPMVPREHISSNSMDASVL